MESGGSERTIHELDGIQKDPLRDHHDHAQGALRLINQLGDSVSLKYNKHYVGLQRDGIADNVHTFRPRQKHHTCEFRIDRSDELDALIEASGLTPIQYNKRWRRYRLQLKPLDLETHQAYLLDLIRLARQLPAAPLEGIPESPMG